MPEEARILLLALGSNLGDRDSHLAKALELLSTLPGLELWRESRRRLTRPVGGPEGQGDYLNTVCSARSSLPPGELLRQTQAIERGLGRRREAEVRWGPRVIDIDILVYGELILNGAELTLPHPRLRERRFVLEPLAEIVPELPLPPDGVTATTLLERLPPS
ncbi:MAG: 2-amino-4-hydroxy-6-hydroxymethyldihydropteridine diphosphokinase [Planctomycetota bacterium]|jgi:2-amino-4-hydroxy-6-hydroxymethyldihydropteridine diphosphokinase|nr:2-amino-4-hydroxy-6-hydroxymethyldihydropteridine diphosphokinase [Planctomycetota bacterium]